MDVRDYEGDGIVVHWDAERCEHSGRCIAGAPMVFDPTARPWITAGALGADDLAAVIDTCPSGALSYTRTDGAAHGRRGHGADEDPTVARRPDDRAGMPSAAGPADDSAPTVAVGVSWRRDGPIVVEGPVQVHAPDGTVETVERLFLCRCGGSATKPRCDGTHKRIGFRAEGVEPVSRAGG